MSPITVFVLLVILIALLVWVTTAPSARPYVIQLPDPSPITFDRDPGLTTAWLPAESEHVDLEHDDACDTAEFRVELDASCSADSGADWSWGTDD